MKKGAQWFNKLGSDLVTTHKWKMANSLWAV